MLEVEKLKKIDQEYQEKKRELQQQKSKINLTKIQKIEEEQKRLAQKLEQLINEPIENEQEEMLKLVALKRRVAEAQKQEMMLLEEQYLKKKELEIQENVRKKIELEKILEKKKELNDQFRKTKIELDMIEQEELNRKNQMKKYIEKALKHDILNIDNEKEKQQIKDILVEQMVADQKEKENILGEIQAVRQQQKDKIKFEFQQKLRELNDQRFQLNQEGEQLLIKKAQHFELQKNGVEFMSNIEQGYAPPIEYILQNMQNINEDEYRKDFDIEEITEKAKQIALKGNKKIESLKQQLNEFSILDPYTKPYKGELKPIIQKMNPENVYIARLIVDWLIEQAIRQYLEKQNIYEATKEKQQYIQEKAKRLQDKINQASNEINYVSIRDRIFEKVLNKIIREAAIEIATGKDQKVKENIKQSTKDKQEEHEDQDQEEDKTILKLYPESDCINQLGTQDIIEIEKQYWKSITLENQKFISHNSRNKYFVSAICISFNKEFIAIGYSNGLVQVFDTFTSQLVAIVEQNQQKAIKQVIFAYDNISQLIALDEDGNVTVNYNATNIKGNKPNKNKEDQYALNFLLYYDLNWKWITRGGKANVQDDLKIVTSIFHPGITFTGVQPSILLGCQGGLIMKFNSNKDLYQNQIYKFPIHNVINTHIITNYDVEFPSENQNLIDFKDNYASNNQKPPNIFREFFVEHKAKIVQIFFINKPETFISIDSKGYIYYWIYEKEQYNVKSNGYKPKSKFKVYKKSSYNNKKQKKVVTESMYYVPKEKKGKDDADNLKKIELATKEMTKDQGGSLYYKKLIEENPTYENDLIQQTFIPNLQNIADIVITKEQFPTESDQDVIFYKGRVNYKTQKFEKGYIYECQIVSGNKYIYIEQVYPHKIDTDLVIIQFIRFDTTLFKLKKVKISIESPVVDGVDFTVVENFTPFGIPYLFVLLRQGLMIISCATGSKLQLFDQYFNDIIQEAKLNNVVFGNIIKHLLDQFIFICVSDCNGVYKYHIVDSNDSEQKRKILSNQLEFKRLYSI
ncbi:hypothetical protein IMG5_011370 [Ichthyophthirius multifiliis]|uniref:Uncharacterized protein n=1 Tax=Ichthyophthirius multifiliis TaxID=5932 RepID=G0QK14_ICHMU|nr:hypothetical protein IMG5_011370 [Ichthyophthirius multifiliis]EGR34441.1 hypothetical protein IMG5_011370 [Ichthyophthirius multifiliis]|eukprot:XP_004039745.1 hypothetical protein IMG5_011370 [Ichthyophthirius multifiliis]